MSWAYLFKHWIATLLIAPMILEFILISNGESNMGEFWIVYSIAVMFGSLFLVPTLIIYAIVYYRLMKNNAEMQKSKFILIACFVIGVIITYAVAGRSMKSIIFYSITAIITGIIFKLKPSNQK